MDHTPKQNVIRQALKYKWSLDEISSMNGTRTDYTQSVAVNSEGQ